MTHNVVTMHVIARGIVQGVWFRDWLTKKAQQNTITGWVRNRSDGSLEAVLHGTKDAVENMCQLMRKGPPLAQVRSLETNPYQGSIDANQAFYIRPTLKQSDASHA